MRIRAQSLPVFVFVGVLPLWLFAGSHGLAWVLASEDDVELVDNVLRRDFDLDSTAKVLAASLASLLLLRNLHRRGDLFGQFPRERVQGTAFGSPRRAAKDTSCLGPNDLGDGKK